MHAVKAIVLAGLGLLTATPAAIANNRSGPAVRISVLPRHRCRTVTRQVWVPARWVEQDRVVQVPGYWQTYNRIETVPGHWETYDRVVNAPGHWKIGATPGPVDGRWRTRTRRVYVPGRFVTGRHGRQHWVPAHQETRTERVYRPGHRRAQRARRWVPGRRRTVTARRWVPASQRTVQDRRWIPATTRTERTRVFQPGYYETRTEVRCRDHDRRRSRPRNKRGVRVGLGGLQVQVGW